MKDIPVKLFRTCVFNPGVIFRGKQKPATGTLIFYIVFLTVYLIYLIFNLNSAEAKLPWRCSNFNGVFKK